MQPQAKTPLKRRETQRHATIAKALPYLEGAALTLLVVAGFMSNAGIAGGLELLMIALSTLAMTFFFRINSVPDIDLQEDSRMGFKELLAFMILPKVFWISCSVSTIGVQFAILKLNGAAQMLFIGTTSLGTALVVFAILLPAIGPNIKIYRPILMRALPVLAVAVYMLLNTPFD